MNLLKHVTSTAVSILVVGLALGIASGLLESQSLTNPGGSWGQYTAAFASKLFTLAIVLIVIAGVQIHRSSMASRLKQLEEELSRLKEKQTPLSV